MIDLFKLFRDAHTKSDRDLGPNSIHHTLGKGPRQAAPGNHNHNDDYVWLDSPAVHVRTNAAQSLANSPVTPVAINWTEEIRDTANMWSISDPDGIIIMEDGYYEVFFTLALDNTAAGLLHIELAVDGTVRKVLFRGQANDASVAPVVVSGGTFIEASEEDVLALRVFHNTGGARTLYNASAAYYTEMSVRKVGISA